MADATVTLRTLSLGSQDSTTGWYATSYATSSIEAAIMPRGSGIVIAGTLHTARYENTLFTETVCYSGDEILDGHSQYWQVQTVTHLPWLDQTIGYQNGIVQRPFTTPPTTSGTWHLDSDSAKTDPRYRFKYLFDNNLTSANLKEDNGSTQASWITCFDGAPYPLEKVLITKAVDLIFSIGKKATKPQTNAYHQIYAFDETVTVTAYAMDKSGLTATNLLEQAEQEIRHVITDNPTASVRIIDTITSDPAYTDLGATKLWHTTVTITYRRINDDLTPTTPTFTDQPAFTYEGDRTSGGTEGTWTLTQNGSTGTQTIDEYKQLDMEITAFVGDMSTVNGTNLGLSTTLYTKARFRYKTSGSATIKITCEFSDTNTQTWLSETASATWTVGTVTITSGKTLDHITIHCCDGVGHAYLDFIQIYAGMYILPNCITMSPPFMVKVADLNIPARSGDPTQIMGTNNLEIRMTCDLDMEPSALSWKRAQTGAATDKNNIDILLETLHYEGANTQYLWVWLDLGDPTIQFKAQLVEINPTYTGNNHEVELVWREYRHGSASNEKPSERFGLSL